MLATSFYAALLALFFVALSARTIRMRRHFGIALGSADNNDLLRATRVHANFAEYTPLALLLILMLEIQGAPLAFVHILGVSLISGRLIHAQGVSQTNENTKYRVAGMVLTFTTIGSAALGIMLLYLSSN